MFAVHDHAHKNRVLMSLSFTGAKISTKMSLCQGVYKIQIRTNPQCLISAIATFNLLFFKAITFKSVQYWVPIFRLDASFWESSLHVFFFWLWQGCFRTIGKISSARTERKLHIEDCFNLVPRSSWLLWSCKHTAVWWH